MNAPAAPVDRAPAWLSVLRLCRIGTWFSPAADVLASTAIVGLALDANVVAAMFASVLIYGAGMVLNDVADVRIDREQRPERPLPRGDLPLAFAAGLGAALLAGALWLSPCRSHHATIAGLVLVYDFLAKRNAWIGALNMGVLRAFNLATGIAMVAADDLPQGVQRAVLVAALCYGLYIVAVTFLGIFEDSRTVSGRTVAAVQTVPPVLAVAGVAAVQGSAWPAPALLAVPALWFLRRNARIRHWDQSAIRRSMLFLLLGTMVYTAMLTFAAGRWPEAMAILAAIPIARAIARRIALT